MSRTPVRFLPLLLVTACATAPRAQEPVATVRLLEVEPEVGSYIREDTEVRVRAAYTLPPAANGSTAALMFAMEGGFASASGARQVTLNQTEGVVEFTGRPALVYGTALRPYTAAVVIMKLDDDGRARQDELPPELLGPAAAATDTLAPETRVRVGGVSGARMRPIARTPAIYYNGEGPATPNRLPALDFDGAVAEYLTYGDHKAFAVATARDGSQQWGYSFGYDTVEEATARALDECRSRIARSRLRATCELYAVDNEILEVADRGSDRRENP